MGKTSQYYGVSRAGASRVKSKNTASRKWVATLTRDGVKIINSICDTEREAAKMIDLCLIRRGEAPRNIYKKVL